MQNKKIKLKTLCLLAVFLASAVPAFAVGETRLFGTEGLLEAQEDVIKNITPKWFNNQAPWLAPKEHFNGMDYTVSRNEVYRKTGSVWENVTPFWENSFTRKIVALESCNGKIYLGTYSRAWAEVWESENGITWKNITPTEKRKLIYTDPEGKEIEIVGAPDSEVIPTMWGGSYFEVSFLQEFGSYLYAGLASGTGAKIFRFDGHGWEDVTPDWPKQNVNIKAATVFKDELLVGTYNNDGAQLWKLSRDSTWDQIAFGGVAGIRINALEIFGNALYIGLFDGSGKSEIIKTLGFDDFTLVTPQKWQELPQFEIISLETVGNALFTEIFVDRDKVEIWKLKDDTWYKIEETLPVEEEKEVGEVLELDRDLTLTDSKIKFVGDQVFESLKVMGGTVLGETSIVGNLSVGLLRFDDLESSINALGEPLKIQNNFAARAVEIFGGKITLDPNGDIKTTGKLFAKEIEVKELKVEKLVAVEGINAGSGAIKAGESSTFVETVSVTPSSKIIITATRVTHQPLAVSEKEVGRGFTVGVTEPVLEDLPFDWWIVDTVGGIEEKGQKEATESAEEARP